MSLASQTSSVIRDLRNKTLEIKITATGNYQNSGTTGDVLNLYANTTKLGQSDANFGYPATIDNGEIIASPPGFIGVLVPGATPQTWGLRVYQSGANGSPLAELGNGAYPAGVTGSSFTARFRGPKLRI